MRFTLYPQVVLATILGAAFGWLDPAHAAACKPLGDLFIQLVKLTIGPIIFCTLVLGIAGHADRRKVGRLGLKALLYFEVVSTIALALGLLLGNLLHPGAGFHANPAAIDPAAVAGFAAQTKAVSPGATLLHIVPRTFFDAFTVGGDLLQVLFLTLLFGFGLSLAGEKGAPMRAFLESASQVFFKIIHLIMHLAPLGAFGAMAFTVGAYGLQALTPLLSLMGTFYLTCLLFVGLVLGAIAYASGYNVFRFVWFIREEMLLVLSTSSSETALVPLMEKLERLGCTRSTVGLVIPAGYSFNLDGTNIYLTLAVLFLAQAMDVPLTLGQQLAVLAVAVVSSKGAAAVTGSGFITLAATLAAVPSVPVAGLALILGIDRFMSEARALTNIVGNGVATLAMARWEGEVTAERLRARLSTGAVGLDVVAR